MTDLLLESTNSIHLPDNYIMRPTENEDMQACVELFNACAREDYGKDEYTVEDLQMEWSNPKFNLAKSTRLVETPEGKIVGYIEVWDVDENPVRIWTWARTYPSYEGQGIGTSLRQWAEERANQAIDRCPPEARVSYQATCKTGKQEAEKLFESLDMTLVRHFYTMLIEMDEAPPQPEFPAEISVRHINVQEELEAVVKADKAAFKDHWGYVDNSLEDTMIHWKHWVESEHLFDETLWFVAIDDSNGEIAGICLCRAEAHDDPESGYVNTLGVLREYRKKGIGLALLHHAFGEYWRRGKQKVTLGVDASSITGATRLYQRAGMHIHKQSSVYEKELRSGEELANTATG